MLAIASSISALAMLMLLAPRSKVALSDVPVPAGAYLANSIAD
jgi:hypothetical protein